MLLDHGPSNKFVHSVGHIWPTSTDTDLKPRKTDIVERGRPQRNIACSTDVELKVNTRPIEGPSAQAVEGQRGQRRNLVGHRVDCGFYKYVSKLRRNVAETS